MAISPDFPNGLDSVEQYLDTRHHLRPEIQGDIGENARIVAKTEFDYSVREVICSLLAGKGLKLPNIQICLDANLGAMLGHPNFPAELAESFQALSDSLTEFMEHTKLESVLGRLNNAIADITQVANMINFCATPIAPVAITNVLEKTMNSYLGAGKELCDSLGKMSQVSDCLSFDPISGTATFNDLKFSGQNGEGLLNRMADNWEAITSGSIAAEQIAVFKAEAIALKQSFNSMMSAENAVSAAFDLGGSQFTAAIELGLTPNEELGVLHNAASVGIQGNTKLAISLKSAYDSIGGYPVIDNNNVVHENVFELFLEPEMIRMLQNPISPSPDIGETQPVYNYCGEIIGFTTTHTQVDTPVSVGDTPTIPEGNPGYNAGGIPTGTSGISSGTSGTSGLGDTTVINNLITNTGTTVINVDTVEDMLTLVTKPEGTIFVVASEGISYTRNSLTTGTSADFTPMSAPIGDFITHLESNTSVGVVVKSGDISKITTIVGTTNEILVSNGNGDNGNIVVSIPPNPIIQGTQSISVPSGTTFQRPGAGTGRFRYNTTKNEFEGYFTGGASPGWYSFASLGGSGVFGATNIGAGTGLFTTNDAGTLQFKTLKSTGMISLTANDTEITISENLTISSLGTGNSIVGGRVVNDLQLKSLVAGQNVALTSDANTVTIDVMPNTMFGSVITTNNTPTEVLFGGSRKTPPLDTAWFFTLTAIGKMSGGLTMAIKREGTVDNTNSTVTIMSDDSNHTIYNNNASSAWDITVSDESNDFRVYVIGNPSSPVNWTVKLDVVGVYQAFV